MTPKYVWLLTVALLLSIPQVGRAEPVPDEALEETLSDSSPIHAQAQPSTQPSTQQSGQSSKEAPKQQPVVIVPTPTGPQLLTVPLTSPAEGMGTSSKSKEKLSVLKSKAAPVGQLKPAGKASPAQMAVGSRYRVRAGETLSAIASRHGTTISAIARANGLRSIHNIQKGQVLLIPGRSTALKATVRAAPLVIAGMALSRAGLVWPARGVLTSRFGWRYRRHHDGIDVAGPVGSPIYAVRTGTVSFSGWYLGYGRLVVLEHAAGMTSVYGHAARVLVKEGQFVQRGQVIALVGCTGRCSGPHLHFEVRFNGRAVNPLPYLR